MTTTLKTFLIALSATVCLGPAETGARAASADACPHFQTLGQNCRARWQSLTC